VELKYKRVSGLGKDFTASTNAATDFVPVEGSDKQDPTSPSNKDPQIGQLRGLICCALHVSSLLISLVLRKIFCKMLKNALGGRSTLQAETLELLPNTAEGAFREWPLLPSFQLSSGLCTWRASIARCGRTSCLHKAAQKSFETALPVNRSAIMPFTYVSYLMKAPQMESENTMGLLPLGWSRPRARSSRYCQGTSWCHIGTAAVYPRVRMF